MNMNSGNGGTNLNYSGSESSQSFLSDVEDS